MPSPGYVWAGEPPSDEDRAAYADAIAWPFWLERRPEVNTYERLSAPIRADLCIVGGGFTGLWAALAAKERDPGRRVVLLEGERIGEGASGRNGGFVEASITHGLENGLARFPEEMRTIERLGLESFDGLQADIERFGIDCSFEPTGELGVALEPHQAEDLEDAAALLRDYGHDIELLGRDELRAQVASPTYEAAIWDKTGCGIVDPARLADGLAASAAGLGVEIFEGTRASGLESDGDCVLVRTTDASVRAERVVLATNAFPPLVRRIRPFIVPVYDYVLVTEPLSAGQKRSIGWKHRQGIGDLGNQFHYYRLTDDDRILWGGFEAVYRYGGPVDARYDTDEGTFAALSRHFFITFPQLRGLRFTHKWGGAIDTCSRFSCFFDLSHKGRVAFVGGYTGLGVGASRFGGRTALDLVDGIENEATGLEYVRRKPVPFPPEPLRWAVIQLTRNRLAAADRNAGRRGLWLRTLDRFGLGFDS